MLVQYQFCAGLLDWYLAPAVLGQCWANISPLLDPDIGKNVSSSKGQLQLASSESILEISFIFNVFGNDCKILENTRTFESYISYDTQYLAEIFEVLNFFAYFVIYACLFCRRELEFLRSQQKRASEVRSAEEVERRKELEASHQQLELQKKYLEEIREEQELARKRAEDEIRQVY